MADVTLAGFRTQFPELPESVHNDRAVDLALEEARLIHGYRPLATLLIAAHILTLNAQVAVSVSAGGSAISRGKITSETSGPLKTTYQTTASGGMTAGSSDSDAQSFIAYWEQTLYGERFLVVERRSPRFTIGAVVTN